jgi:hypothetical protein
MRQLSNDPGLDLSALVTLARVSHAAVDDEAEGLHDELQEIVDGLKTEWAQPLGRALVSPEHEAQLNADQQRELFIVRKLAGIDADESEKVA